MKPILLIAFLMFSASPGMAHYAHDYYYSGEMINPEEKDDGCVVLSSHSHAPIPVFYTICLKCEEQEKEIEIWEMQVEFSERVCAASRETVNELNKEIKELKEELSRAKTSLICFLIVMIIITVLFFIL